MEIQDMVIYGAVCREVEEICCNTEVSEDIRARIVAAMGILGKVQKTRLDRELEIIGLTAAQVQVLLYILKCNGENKRVTAKELEQRFHVSNPTMSGILKRLEKKEWIERITDKSDRRNKWIQIKGDVIALCQSVEERIRMEMERAFQSFTQEELERLLQLMQKLLHNMEQDGKEE